MDEADARQRLEALLAEFDTAMLVTHFPDGRLRSRPIVILTVRDDDAVVFAGAIDAPGTEPLRQDSEVNVVLQSGERFVSVTGKGRVVADRTLLDRLGSDSWRVWFPGGPGDPTLCLIRVVAEEAESWDRTGARGLRSVFQPAT
jgi:general stress protein 26